MQNEYGLDAIPRKIYTAGVLADNNSSGPVFVRGLCLFVPVPDIKIAQVESINVVTPHSEQSKEASTRAVAYVNLSIFFLRFECSFGAVPKK